MNNDLFSQIRWGNRGFTSTRFIGMVALNNWCIDTTKGMTSNIPTRVTDDLPRDIIKGNRLGKVEALLIIGWGLVVSTNVVDRLSPSPLQTVNVSSIRVLWPIWVAWIDWLIRSSWLVRRNRRRGVLQNNEVSLDSAVIIVVGSTSWEAIINQRVTFLLKILDRLGG